MKKTLAVLTLFALCSCTALMDKTPRTQSLTRPDTLDQAYGRAMRALAQMGAKITQADPLHHVIQGEVHNAVALLVIMEAVPTGTHYYVTGTLMPNKLAVGSFTEVDDFLALLR